MVNEDISSEDYDADNYFSHYDAYRMAVDSKETSSYYFILFSSLLCLVLILCKYLHDSPRISSYLSEAALVLLVGMCAGAAAKFYLWTQQIESGQAFQRLLSFDPNIFFMALLPPILFNLGYQLRRQLFYRHIGLIVLLAAVGTSVSAVACALTLWGIQTAGYLGDFQPTLLELLAFGALIAATDAVSVIAVLKKKRVDPNLFYIVFGESALNDAVALVLYNCFADLLREHKTINQSTLIGFAIDVSIEAIGSPLLGFVWGLIAAVTFGAVDMRNKENRMFELSLYLMMMYVPFIVAESLELSGIVTVFFAGVSVRRYAAPNVSPVTERAADTIFRWASFLAETIIFLELGLSVFGFSGSFHWNFLIWSLVASLLGRAVAIYPLTFIHNLFLKRRTAIAEPAEEEKNNTSSSSSWWNFNTAREGFAMDDWYPTLCNEPFACFSVDDDAIRTSETNGLDNPNRTVADPPSTPPSTRKSHASPEKATIAALPDGSKQQQQDPENPSVTNEHLHLPTALSRSSTPSTTASDDGSASSTPRLTAQGSEVSSSSSKRRWKWKTAALRRDQKVTQNMAHLVWFAGLRGAVAYACVRSFPDVFGHNDEFTAATMFVVLFTIIIMGGLTEPLLAWLEIPTGVDEDEYLMQWRRDHEVGGFFHELEKRYFYNQVVIRDNNEKRKNKSHPDNSKVPFRRRGEIEYDEGALLHPPELRGIQSNLFLSRSDESGSCSSSGAMRTVVVSHVQERGTKSLYHPPTLVVSSDHENVSLQSLEAPPSPQMTFPTTGTLEYEMATTNTRDTPREATA